MKRRKSELIDSSQLTAWITFIIVVSLAYEVRYLPTVRVIKKIRKSRKVRFSILSKIYSTIGTIRPTDMNLRYDVR